MLNATTAHVRLRQSLQYRPTLSKTALGDPWLQAHRGALLLLDSAWTVPLLVAVHDTFRTINQLIN